MQLIISTIVKTLFDEGSAKSYGLPAFLKLVEIICKSLFRFTLDFFLNKEWRLSQNGRKSELK